MIATAKLHGRRRTIARGRVRGHRLTLTLKHAPRGRYRVTLVELNGRRAPRVLGSTSLVIN